jgi:undecaprenyl-diphosphatase
VQALLSVLAHLPSVLAYLLAAAVVTAETGTLLGLLLPGELTLLLVGFLCYGGQLRWWVALPVLSAAGLAGDHLAYRAGRRNGPRLRTGAAGRRVGARRWERAESLFRRHGGRAVLFGRFLGVVRTLTPRLAGMAGLRYRRFLPWDAAGVVGLVVGMLALGYLAGSSYEQVAGVYGRATGALLLLVLVIVGIVLVGRWLGRHPDPVAALVARLTRWRPVAWLGRAYHLGFSRLSRRLGVGGAIAVNVVGGVAALIAVGSALSWAIDRLVRHSGLPLVDPFVVSWMTGHRNPHAVELARGTLSVLRGSHLVMLVGFVALALNWRSRAWRGDLLGVLGTVGAFVPLLVLGLVADWAGDPVAHPAESLFPNQTAIVTASLGMLAWLLSRRFGWRTAVASWTAAVAGSIMVAAARVFLGWDWPSGTVAATLLGALWVLVFVIAWRTRDRLSRPPEPAEPSDPDPAPVESGAARPG